MKKLLKFLVFIVIVNFAVGISISGYAAVSIIGSSLKGTDIGITDLLKPHLSSDKASKLEKNMTENSSKLGTEFAKKLESGISKFLPTSNVDFSKIPATPYPYKDPAPLIEQASKEGLQNGLDILKESDKANEAIRNDSLKLNK